MNAPNQYAQKLARWSSTLAAARAEDIVPDLASCCGRKDVERFVANAVGERLRLLTDELAFVALAFDDFDELIARYADTIARKSGGTPQRDAHRCLRWIARHRRLTPKQADFIAYQRTEFAVAARACAKRSQHVSFQRRWAASRNLLGSIDDNNQSLIEVNPTHAWSRMSRPLPGKSSDEPADLLFFAKRTEIRSLTLTGPELQTTRVLIKAAPCSIGDWALATREANRPIIHSLFHALVDAGFVALNSANCLPQRPGSNAQCQTTSEIWEQAM